MRICRVIAAIALGMLLPVFVFGVACESSCALAATESAQSVNHAGRVQTCCPGQSADGMNTNGSSSTVVQVSADCIAPSGVCHWDRVAILEFEPTGSVANATYFHAATSSIWDIRFPQPVAAVNFFSPPRTASQSSSVLRI